MLCSKTRGQELCDLSSSNLLLFWFHVGLDMMYSLGVSAVELTSPLLYTATACTRSFYDPQCERVDAEAWKVDCIFFANPQTRIGPKKRLGSGLSQTRRKKPEWLFGTTLVLSLWYCSRSQQFFSPLFASPTVLYSTEQSFALFVSTTVQVRAARRNRSYCEHQCEPVGSLTSDWLHGHLLSNRLLLNPKPERLIIGQAFLQIIVWREKSYYL